MDTTVERSRSCGRAGYHDLTVYTPIPVHEIEEVLERDRPVSRVRIFTLLGGLTGIASAFLITIWTSMVWGQVTGGKFMQLASGGIIGSSLPPFFIIAFEMMVLFGGFATVIGMIVLGRLPRLKASATFDPRVHQRPLRRGRPLRAGARGRRARAPAHRRCRGSEIAMKARAA